MTNDIACIFYANNGHRHYANGKMYNDYYMCCCDYDQLRVSSDTYFHDCICELLCTCTLMLKCTLKPYFVMV